MNIKEKASFIVANLDLIGEYSLDNVYKEALRERAKQDYGIYIDNEFFNIHETYEENFKRFFDKNILPKFKDIEEFKFFQSFEYPAKKIFKIENDMISAYGMKVYDLIYILIYVVLNEIDPDYKRANEIEKNSGLKYDESHYSFTDFGYFKDIQVKKTKNGHITIKGLNDEQRARLNKVFEVTHR